MTVYVKADLHNYGQTSNDINEGFERIVDRASKTLGLDGVVGIVDVHEKRYSKFKDKTKIPYGDLSIGAYFSNEQVVVLRGVRTFTKDDSSSVLTFGIPEGRYLPRRDNPGEIIKQAHEEYNAVIIAPQSDNLFRYLGKNPDAFALVDAIETFNGNYSIKKDSNKQAELFQKTNAIPSIVITSGGHSISEIGRSWMRIPMLDISSEEELKSSLRDSLYCPRDDFKDDSAFVKAMAYRHGVALQLWSRISGSRGKTLIDGLEVAE